MQNFTVSFKIGNADHSASAMQLFIELTSLALPHVEVVPMKKLH